MEFQIEANPGYSHLSSGWVPSERFVAEGGSMAWVSESVQAKSATARRLPAHVRKLVETGVLRVLPRRPVICRQPRMTPPTRWRYCSTRSEGEIRAPTDARRLTRMGYRYIV